MKKTGLSIILITIFIALSFFGLKAYAEPQEDNNNGYSVIDGEELDDFLSQSDSDYFEDNDIEITDENWVNKITVGSFLGEIVKTLKEQSLKPVRVFFSLLSVILITAAFTGDERKNGVNKTATISAVSVVSLIILSDIWSLITTLVETVRAVCRIVLTFIPVFESAMYLSGKMTTATASGGVLLTVTQGLSLISADYVMPIMGAYSGLGIASSLTPLPMIKQLGNTLKKASITLLSVLFSVFVGIIGFQTTVNAAADNLAIKTTKYIVGTFVPIGGGSLSEAANTLYSSMSLIKSSIGIYAVVSIIVVSLPVIALTLLFKLAFSLSSVVSDSFSQTELSGLISAVNSLLSVALSVILFFCGVFVFSIALVVGLSGGG